MNICFVISSCIFVNKSAAFFGSRAVKRSFFSAEDRIQQTYKTIESIKEKIPGSYIILVDNGDSDPKEFLEDKVDKYQYIGNRKFVQKAALKNKSFGEAVLMLYALPYARKGNFIFKISGRYYLNDKFELEKWDLKKICFLHNTEEFENLKQGEYCYGSHSTVLYGFSKQYYWKIYISYILSLPFIQTTRPIETALPFFCRKPIFYMKQLGVSGLMGGNAEVLSR